MSRFKPVQHIKGAPLFDGAAPKRRLRTLHSAIQAQEHAATWHRAAVGWVRDGKWGAATQCQAAAKWWHEQAERHMMVVCKPGRAS